MQYDLLSSKALATANQKPLARRDNPFRIKHGCQRMCCPMGAAGTFCHRTVLASRDLPICCNRAIGRRIQTFSDVKVLSNIP